MSLHDPCACVRRGNQGRCPTVEGAHRSQLAPSSIRRHGSPRGGPSAVTNGASGAHSTSGRRGPGWQDPAFRHLIIGLIIETIRPDRSESLWTDEASNVSSLDPVGRRNPDSSSCGLVILVDDAAEHVAHAEGTVSAKRRAE